jgi:N-acetylglucosaminyldiphosphoundecaprenol N-acetyl-beta-D-mannosaminyltransferase
MGFALPLFDRYGSTMSMLSQSVRIGRVRFATHCGAQWQVPLRRVGGLPIGIIDRPQSAELMIDVALDRRDTGLSPLIITSANGQVLSLCARKPDIRHLFMQVDLIHADGMSLVFASQLFNRMPIPERICTTDFFHDVARLGQERGASMFLLGATQSVIDEAACRVQTLYPHLRIVGHTSGYMRRQGEEQRVIDAINAAKPDILWIGLGVPLEQQFAVRNRHRLRNVGLIKTSGGLFDVLSGSKPRAPQWIINAGFEWAYRWYLEPGRLAGRYLVTNPHALFLLLTQSGD